VLFSGETAAIHQIGAGASLSQLASIRAGAGMALAAALAWRRGVVVWRTAQLRLQLLRGVVTLLYMWVMIFSFAHLPYADGTAISYTQSAYIALFSVLILGETVTAVRWAASAIAILGALLIAKPSFASWNGVYLVALIGSGFNGLAFVLNRYLQRGDGETTTLFYSSLVPLIANLPVACIAGLPESATFLWLPGLLVFGPLGTLAGIIAVKHASTSALGPYTLLRLVIAIVAGFIIFREMPDPLSALGATLILASCLLGSVNLSTVGLWRSAVRMLAATRS
jgi:drug/metabolite transporter (DMT)-like permease